MSSFKKEDSSYNQDTFNKVSSIIAEQLGVDKEKVKLDSDLTEELGMDSLDSVELVMALEEAYGIEIPDDDAEKIRKVSDILDYFAKKKIQ
jgi:acyl carrier protein